MKKVLIVLIVLALLGALGWQIYRKTGGSKTLTRSQNPPVAVEVAPVETGLIREMGRYTGSLKPSSQFVVAPRIPGRLKRLLVNIGDQVKRNQVVVQIVDEEYRLQVEQAKAALAVSVANLAEAKSNLDLAKKEYDRAASLGGKRIVTQSELEVAEARFKAAQAKERVAQAMVAEKKAALKEAEVRLSYTQIEARWQGGSETRLVGEKFVDEGSLLAVNTPIVTILELNPIVGVIHVIERDYPRLKVGQEVSVTTEALPERIFKGRIARVAPLIKEASRQARVELEIPNPDQVLKPGMFIRAEVEFARHQGATIVPVTALVRRNGQTGVFVADLERKKVRFVLLELGISEARRAQVLRPALSGMVVVMGHHLLEDGAGISLPGPRTDKSGQPSPAAGTQASGPQK
ncbi:MAG: efflux RND transporter periplasmic adaptor subunit [Deltaproteobacteria bacterium]|nr:efflux RND transporter periplasmic adaptor subunit [Deltaproteobacteria bacterium]